MHITPEEIVETLLMITQQNLDIRTVTLGLSLAGCADSDIDVDGAQRVYDHVTARRRAPRARRRAASSASTASRSCNKRISVTPDRAARRRLRRRGRHAARRRRSTAPRTRSASTSSAASRRSCTRASATATAGSSPRSPRALAATERVCASVNVATTRAGINMDAVLRDGARPSRRPPRRPPTATASAARSSSSSPTWSRTTRSWPAPCTASGEPDAVINVGISGPGVVRAVVDVAARGRRPHRGRRGDQGDGVQDHPRGRARRARGRATPRRARWASSTSRSRPRPPRATPSPRSSRRWAWSAAAARARPPRSRCSTTPSRRAARWARSSIGGLSGAFIPVSEDQGMIRAAESRRAHASRSSRR